MSDDRDPAIPRVEARARADLLDGDEEALGHEPQAESIDGLDLTTAVKAAKAVDLLLVEELSESDPVNSGIHGPSSW
jgi:heme oxygenase